MNKQFPLSVAVRYPTPRANKIGGYSSEEFSPTLEQVAKRYPTPRAQMERGPCWDRVKSGEHKHNLEDFIAIQEGASADDGTQCLNPHWVELLMGFRLAGRKSECLARWLGGWRSSPRGQGSTEPRK